MRPLGLPHVNAVQPYQPGKPVSELRRELGLEGEIIKLASNENALGPSPKALAALRSAAEEVHRYPDGGAFYLKHALAERHDVPPSRILLGAGSNEHIDLVVRAFVGPEDHVVVASHGFLIYRLVCLQNDRRFTALPPLDYRYDLDGMADAVTDETRVVFIDSPNNPTGHYVGEAELRRFLGRLPDDVLLVLDEAYYEYVTAGDYPDSIALQEERPRTVTLRTFSKIYGLAGLRVGYSVASEEVTDFLDRARQPFNCNAMAQAAALAALDDQEHVGRTRRNNAAGIEQLTAGYEALGLSFEPTQTNFFLVHLGRPALPVFEAMLRQGVIVRPMGQLFPESLRITIGTPADNERCLSALAVALEEVGRGD